MAAARLPWRPDLWDLAGQAAFLAGDPSQAVTWFTRGETRQALSLAGWIAYGDALAALGDQPDAKRAWERSILQHGASAGAARRLALVALQENDLPTTLAYLEQALSLDEQDAWCHYQRGLLLAATDPGSALPDLTRAAELDPALDENVQYLRTELNRASLVTNLAYQYTVSGRALASLGEWSLATEAFRRAVEADNSYAEAWAWLGEALQQAGEDGRQQLVRALSLDPGSASVQALDGMYWMRQGQFDSAFAAYEKAALIEPENGTWQVSLGDAASASGDLITALQHYRIAVDLAPQDASAWRSLAVFCIENETDVENTGLAAVRELLRLEPQDWLTNDLAGRLALMLSAPVEAELRLLKAIELAPQEPAPHLHLALAYLAGGQTSLAYDKLKDTLALDPSGPFGWQAKRMLEFYFP
jgi:tetratricopeptide (TPR) repeat protein